MTASRHLLLLNLQGTSEEGQYSLDGKPAGFVRRKPGSILFIPAGCTWHGWEAGASTAAYLSVTVAPSFVRDILSRTSLPLTLAPDLACEDPVLVNAARGIGEEIQGRSPLSGLLVESYISTIFVQLLRRQRYIPSVRKGGLAPASLNKVLEKIDEDLTLDLSLSQLAGLAGLSIPHFCRAFKQTLGYPPYAFIVHRRIDRAKEYLRHSSMTVTEIAFACGFSNSSHFSNAFRREVGMTPVAYRGT